MPHATAIQPPAFLVTPEPPTRGQERVSDIVLARAIAQAVRAAPGVADLSAGHVALAATYGAGQRVIGVVMRHPMLDQVVVEIHVVLSADHCNVALAGAAQRSGKRGAREPGLLVEIARQIRKTAFQTLRDMVPQGRLWVDVFIDDLR